MLLFTTSYLKKSLWSHIFVGVFANLEAKFKSLEVSEESDTCVCFRFKFAYALRLRCGLRRTCDLEPKYLF